jgi:hypothetical protein
VIAGLDFIDTGSTSTAAGYKIFNLTDTLANITTYATGAYLGYQTYYYNINVI